MSQYVLEKIQIYLLEFIKQTNQTQININNQCKSSYNNNWSQILILKVTLINKQRKTLRQWIKIIWKEMFYLVQTNKIGLILAMISWNIQVLRN